MADSRVVDLAPTLRRKRRSEMGSLTVERLGPDRIRVEVVRGIDLFGDVYVLRNQDVRAWMESLAQSLEDNL